MHTLIPVAGGSPRRGGPMLALYVISLILGGGLLLLSVLFGGEAEGLEEEIGGEAGEGGLGRVLPLASLFFWTFFLAFLGLTGVLLTFLAPGMGGLVIAGLAVGMGLLAALAAGSVLRRLGRGQVDSNVGPGDVVGRLGQVVVPVGRGRTGKVRIELKGRTVELLAHGDDEELLAPSHQVLVHDVLEDGSVHVISAERPMSAGTPAPGP
jgi:membrane protein implicated in regulation of membrane protease activity